MGVESLKSRVAELHAEHGTGGNVLACLECVVAALNEYEGEYVRRIKEMNGGR